MALYIVGTPIGNLSDISPRALDILKSADIVLVEKWSDSIKLLNKFEIKPKQLLTLDESQGKEKFMEFARQGEVALITSAGTPGVSDPGADLVALCHENDVKVVPIPGPSALTTAISASGFRGDFLFVHFLPKKKNDIREIFEKAKSNKSNLVFFESPYRLKKTIKFMIDEYPDCKIFLGKEMTKKFERYVVTSPLGVLELIQSGPKFLKGEFTLIVDFG